MQRWLKLPQWEKKTQVQEVFHVSERAQKRQLPVGDGGPEFLPSPCLFQSEK